MAELHNWNSTRIHILYAVGAYPGSSGVEIKSKLSGAYGEELKDPRFYNALDDLVDAGLVAKEAMDRRTNRYTITENGERALREYHSWLSSLYYSSM